MDILATQKGWLVRYTNGATSFVLTSPMEWPLSIIRNVMCITPMLKPVVPAQPPISESVHQ